MITVEGIDGGIAVRFPYNKDYIEKIKTINGYMWNLKEKYWSFPNDDGIVEKIVPVFAGENINIGSALQDFDALERELVLRKYSSKTIKSYLHLEESNIKDYLLYLVEEKDAVTSTLNTAINALRFYYSKILKRDFVYEINRIKKDKKLPIVLSQNEVSRILSAVSNIWA